jgi:hypothetical protein
VEECDALTLFPVYQDQDNIVTSLLERPRKVVECQPKPNINRF